MKIEAGKTYKMRNGKRVHVVAVATNNPFGKPSSLPVVGYREDCGGITQWRTDGKESKFGESESDIVAEWREPVTKEITVYLWPNGEISFYPASFAIASTRVLLTEGVFAEGKE